MDRNYDDHRDLLEKQLNFDQPGIDPKYYPEMSDEDLIEEAYSYAPLDLVVELHSRGIIITDFENQDD